MPVSAVTQRRCDAGPRPSMHAISPVSPIVQAIAFVLRVLFYCTSSPAACKDLALNTTRFIHHVPKYSACVDSCFPPLP